MFRWICLAFTIFHSLYSDSWMDRKAKEELFPFAKQGISQELIDTTWKHCKKYKEFKRFKIIDSVVYGDECAVKNLLKALVKRYPIPNVDFIYYNEDRLKPTFFKRSHFKSCAPIFVSAKHRSLKRAVLFSDWMYDFDDEKGGWNGLIQTINAHANIAWEQKVEKLFWRGTPWDGKHFGMYTFENWKTIPRGRLVFESQKRPDLINATLSTYPDNCVNESLKKCEEILGKISFVPWDEVLSYKYHMAIDGVTCSFPATQWKLLSGSVLFKQESSDVMYFYGELIPWKHYIPVKNDLSDLIQKLQWAKAHDTEAKTIAENGRAFAQENLSPEQILEYCSKVLIQYAKLQQFNPSLF